MFNSVLKFANRYLNKLFPFSVQNRYETGDSSRNNDPVACRRQCSTYELRKTDNDDQESDTPVAGTVKHDGENNCSGCESCDEAVSLVIVIEPENDVAADVRLYLQSVSKFADRIVNRLFRFPYSYNTTIRRR